MSGLLGATNGDGAACGDCTVSAGKLLRALHAAAALWVVNRGSKAPEVSWPAAARVWAWVSRHITAVGEAGVGASLRPEAARTGNVAEERSRPLRGSFEKRGSSWQDGKSAGRAMEVPAHASSRRCRSSYSGATWWPSAICARLDAERGSCSRRGS